MSLSRRPRVSIDIKICSFIFKISCWQVRWDERTDGRTNGQHENIMPSPVSLSWWRNIKGQNSLEPGICNFTHMGWKIHLYKIWWGSVREFWCWEASNFTILRRLVYCALNIVTLPCESDITLRLNMKARDKIYAVQGGPTIIVFRNFYSCIIMT